MDWAPLPVPRAAVVFSSASTQQPSSASITPSPMPSFPACWIACSSANNPEHHARTKHIDIQHHFIRQRVADKTIALQFVGTAEMVADILTKALERVEHERGACGLGQSQSSSRGGVDKRAATAG